MNDNHNCDDDGDDRKGGRKDYEVGYGRPPKHSQFPKNTSGNPGGRPTGSKGLGADLKAELNEFVTITVDGKRKRVSKRRLVIKALAAKAAAGNVQAADKLLSLIIQAEGFEDQRPSMQRLSKAEQQILDQLLGNEEPERAAEAEGSNEQEDDPQSGEA